ncbi:hypothetical protein [Brasilonema sp. UFV-L1]|uniref:hypothetical protein n=1 Tax=Brasilonema sp. UFV-L1 TaxID=2234130 RepID=UPI00145DBCCE|nr:hypothetical protein [Brasilonema sp. UFV-L1]NMG11045.1 hypothetical protein [Brasilonema sp. UFV-L1]
MLQSRWFKILRFLGLEFWLPLPLLGLAFWVGSGFVMDTILLRDHQSTNPLKVETLLAKQSPTLVLSITVQIKKHQGISRVRVKTASKAQKKLEFEFPITELSALEAAISKELRLPIDDVRKLMRASN